MPVADDVHLGRLPRPVSYMLCMLYTAEGHTNVVWAVCMTKDGTKAISTGERAELNHHPPPGPCSVCEQTLPWLRLMGCADKCEVPWCHIHHRP